MASPPPYRSPATSPPNPSQITLPNPKKRPSLSMTSFGPSKRRKPPSVASTTTPGTSHPLRQTSFPPEENPFGLAAERSPSVESDVTGVTGGRSVVTAGVGSKKGKGKRKKKGGEESVRSGVKTIGGEEASVSGLAGEEPADEEEEEGDADEGVQDEEGRKMDKAAEKKNLAVLVDAFNVDQAERYNMFRRIKLKKETVRKITNQTLSQSVPPSVITTINGYIKVFIGLIVERARTIQQQEATPPPSPYSLLSVSGSTFPLISHPIEANSIINYRFNSSSHRGDSGLRPPLQITHKGGAAGGGDRSDSSEAGTTKPAQPPPQPPPPYLGPLLPDHIREALRRYRRDGEGGGTGMGGWSLGLGVPGKAVARTKGRRLFR